MCTCLITHNYLSFISAAVVDRYNYDFLNGTLVLCGQENRCKAKLSVWSDQSVNCPSPCRAVARRVTDSEWTWKCFIKSFLIRDWLELVKTVQEHVFYNKKLSIIITCVLLKTCNYHFTVFSTRKKASTFWNLTENYVPTITILKLAEFSWILLWSKRVSQFELVV